MVAHDLGERNHKSFRFGNMNTPVFGRCEFARANIKASPESFFLNSDVGLRS